MLLVADSCVTIPVPQLQRPVRLHTSAIDCAVGLFRNLIILVSLVEIPGSKRKDPKPHFALLESMAGEQEATGKRFDVHCESHRSPVLTCAPCLDAFSRNRAPSYLLHVQTEPSLQNHCPDAELPGHEHCPCGAPHLCIPIVQSGMPDRNK